MIFTAYLDESGTHGESPTVVMGGFFASARTWEVFERKLRKLHDKYGFTNFHGKEFKARSGQFAGWTDPRRFSFVNDLVPLIRYGGLADSFSVSLTMEKYRAYRQDPRPKGYSLDSQYGICFRKALGYFALKVLEQGQNHKLHLILEQGHRNAADAVRIFDEIKASHPVPEALLRGISFLPKDATPLLSLADFIAYTQFRRYQDEQAGRHVPVSHGPSAKGETPWHHLEIPESSLDQLKIDWEKAKQQRAEKWRAAKANRGAYEE